MVVWTMIPFTDAHTHRIPADNRIQALLNLSLETDSIPPVSSLLFSWGIHPKDAGRTTLEIIRKQADSIPLRAIGECGLDPGVPVDRETQKRCFTAQLDLACERDLPVIIHCVRRQYDLIGIRKRYPVSMQPWVIHGFRGNPQMAGALLKAGFVLSLSPVWLLHQTVFPAGVPQDHFLLETDDSDIGIAEVYRHTASLLHQSMDDLKNMTFRLFQQCFDRQGEK